MSRDFTLSEPPDDSVTILGIISRRLGMTQGQLYTVVLVLLVTAALLLTGLPGAHKTDPDAPIDPITEVQP